MTLEQFTRLCQQEWSDRCGDVTGLSLTAESRAELAAATLLDSGTGAVATPPLGDDGEPVPVGLLLTEILNRVTRTVVKVSGSAGVDLVHVARPIPA